MIFIFILHPKYFFFSALLFFFFPYPIISFLLMSVFFFPPHSREAEGLINVLKKQKQLQENMGCALSLLILSVSHPLLFF